MKNKYLQFVLLALLFCPLFQACKKDDKPAKTKTQYLTQQPWKYDQSGFDTDKNGTIDTPDPQDACIADNIFTFNSNGTGVVDEGPTKCNSSDPQTVDFTWMLKNNDTILNAGDLSSNSDATILKLDDTQLILYEDITVAGQTVRYITIFKH